MVWFAKVGQDTEFRQSEILTGLTQYEYDSDTGEAAVQEHAFAIIGHQDCDLLRDFRAYVKDGSRVINGILMVQLRTMEEAKATIDGRAWQRVGQHREDRYHLLPEVSPNEENNGEGLPSLVADFRLIFTMPASEFLKQQAQGKMHRRCMLVHPYREHFQSRLGFYLQRVALPDAD